MSAEAFGRRLCVCRAESWRDPTRDEPGEGDLERGVGVRHLRNVHGSQECRALATSRIEAAKFCAASPAALLTGCRKRRATRGGANLHQAVSHAWARPCPRVVRAAGRRHRTFAVLAAAQGLEGLRRQGVGGPAEEACRHLLVPIGSPGDASLGTASLASARPPSGPACDQAPSAMRPRLTPSMGIRIFLASARLNSCRARQYKCSISIA